MKKLVVKRAVFLIVAIIGLNLISQAQTPTDEFLEVYRQALELNKNRFSNLDLIQIGDVIIFPSRCTDGYEALIAPAPINGQHASLWTLTGDYLQIKIKPLTAEAATYSEGASVKPLSSDDEEFYNYEEVEKQLFLPWWMILALILIFLFLLSGFIKNRQNFWKILFHPKDPNSYKPITANIDDLTSQQLIMILEKFYLQDNERLIAIKQGVLQSNEQLITDQTAWNKMPASMQWDNNKVREIILKSGEKLIKIEIINLESLEIRTQYLHGVCLYGLNFENSRLPLGWKFITSKTILPEIKASKIA